jgi:hypothetical protein
VRLTAPAPCEPTAAQPRHRTLTSTASPTPGDGITSEPANALRFRAYGKRRYITLGTRADGWTRSKPETELDNVIAYVRRGIWQPPQPVEAPPESTPEQTFHEFASESLAARRDEFAPRTVEDYDLALTHHLLPFFAKHRMSEITAREVDRNKAAKVRERERSLVERPLSNARSTRRLRAWARSSTSRSDTS